MTDIDRAIILVMDSVGAGEAPDAAEYGDEGSDTLGHTAEVVGGLDLPNFQAAGLGNLHGSILGVPPAAHPTQLREQKQTSCRRPRRLRNRAARIRPLPQP